jgi:hypothetical protein
MSKPYNGAYGNSISGPTLIGTHLEGASLNDAHLEGDELTGVSYGKSPGRRRLFTAPGSKPITMDEALARLRSANVAFNTPDQARVGEQFVAQTKLATPTALNRARRKVR